MTPANSSLDLGHRVASLRDDVLTLLDEAVHARPGDADHGEMVTALQAAANALGEAERRLGPEPLQPPPVHPHTPARPRTADAAAVLALAESALLHSYDAHDEAERWLRLLRGHGRVGAVLTRLGVGKQPPTT